MSSVGSALMKVGLSAAVVGVVLFRTRKIPNPEMGFATPPIGLSLLFTCLYLGWMLASDALINWRGSWNWAPWLEAPLAASAMRVAAVCILGPIAEELIFRGWFFALLRPRVGALPTIGLTALGWALLHYAYSPLVIGVIAVDGILLGVARWKCGSIYPPMLMHSLYNLYAIW